MNSYYKQELLETRLCILENQTAQNMSINTALITQLSLQNGSTGYYHPHLQHNLQQTSYLPHQSVPLLPPWNTHPAYSQHYGPTQISNHQGLTHHQLQSPYQRQFHHPATGYPGIPQQTPSLPAYATSLHQVSDIYGYTKAPHISTTFIPQPHAYHPYMSRTHPGSQQQVPHQQQSSGRHNINHKVFHQKSSRPTTNSNLQTRTAKIYHRLCLWNPAKEVRQIGSTNKLFSILYNQQCVTTAEIHAIPTEHTQYSPESDQQTTSRTTTINNKQSQKRTGNSQSNSPFRDNCLQEKPPDQKKQNRNTGTTCRTENIRLTTCNLLGIKSNTPFFIRFSTTLTSSVFKNTSSGTVSQTSYITYYLNGKTTPDGMTPMNH
ncbi:unnamed protein product [Mytilus coruscus]|uniref:Uncharacterized protein n=1 Tax=Mytilus coruscus TaxID=42192 RepID=A0A6J8BC04_MYTCO|nr:unnamed protein product [Mytilus coruscus]